MLRRIVLLGETLASQIRRLQKIVSGLGVHCC